VELRRYLAVLRRRALLIVLTVMAAMAAAWIATPRDTSYASSATLYVGFQNLNVDPSGQAPLANDSLAAIERVIRTFSMMIDSEPIAQAALDRAGVDTTPGAVVAATTATPLGDTQLMQIRVVDRDPQVAQALSNAVAESFVDAVQDFEPGADPGEGTVPYLPAYIFDRADLPTTPQPSGIVRNLLLAGIFGFLAAAGLAFLLEYLDITVKSAHDAERRLRLPVLGVIPEHREVGPVTGSA